MKRRAFITGVTGQDGSDLAELLLAKGYEVHGMIRRASYFNRKRIDHLFRDPQNRNVRFFLHYGDMSDSSNMNRVLEKVNPHEIYNLAAQSHVAVSFEVPEYTADVDATGTLPLADSGWCVLRASSDHAEYPVLDNYVYATTSPVYVTVAGRAPRSPADAAWFSAWIDRVREATERHPDWNSPAEKAAVLARLAAARAVYERLR